MREVGERVIGVVRDVAVRQIRFSFQLAIVGVAVVEVVKLR